MKRIINPYKNIKGKDSYNCFGCSPYNEIGLHLHFFDDGEGLVTKWQPQKLLEGYPNVVHGGIQSTLLDEIGAWTIYVKCATTGMTKNLNVSYLHPLRISRGEITAKAKVQEQKKTEAIIKTVIYDGEGKLCTEGILTYFIFPPAIAKRKFNYPGVEAFYESHINPPCYS